MNNRNQDLRDFLEQEFGSSLKSCNPEIGLKRYLNKRRPGVTEQTLKRYKKRLSLFTGYLSANGITDLNDLDGRILDDWAAWRRYESSDKVDELSAKTMVDDLYLLRHFIEYLESIEAVKQGLGEKISIPKLADGDGVRDIDVNPDRVRQILSHLQKFRYGSLHHVVWILLARTGRRTGCIRSLDLVDCNLDHNEPYLEFNHRPDTDTRLKNAEKSEGHVSITDSTAEILSDFIQNNRCDVTDEFGREPLLTTSYGRISSTTVRKIIYNWSRPCIISDSCPHDKDPESCQAAKSQDQASKCPSSRSPHALKHGFISEGRRRGVPIDALSDRCDVTEDVIRKHYDETTEDERCKIRRKVFEQYSSEDGGYL